MNETRGEEVTLWRWPGHPLGFNPPGQWNVGELPNNGDHLESRECYLPAPGEVVVGLTRDEIEEIRHAVPAGRDPNCEVCQRHGSIQAKLTAANQGTDEGSEGCLGESKS